MMHSGDRDRISIGSVLRGAWRLLVRRPGVFVGMGVILFGVQVFGSLLTTTASETGPAVWVYSVVSGLFWLWWLLGLYHYALVLAASGRPTLGELVPPWATVVRGVLAITLYVLATMVCFLPTVLPWGYVTFRHGLPLIGTVLLQELPTEEVIALVAGSAVTMVSGLYVMIRYQLTAVVAVDRSDLGPVGAFRHAGELVEGRWWWFATLQFVVALFTGAATVLTAGVGTIVTTPYATLIQVEVYRRLDAAQKARGSGGASETTP